MFDSEAAEAIPFGAVGGLEDVDGVNALAE